MRRKRHVWLVVALSFAISALPALAQCGATWQDIATGISHDLNGVVYAGGQFVAVGDNGTILTGPDGSTWTSRTSPTGNDLYSVAYGNSRFVAVGNAGSAIYSSDGVTWSNSSLTGLAALHWGGVIYGNGRFVAVGGLPGGGTTYWGISSTDGVTWTPATMTISMEMTDVAYGASAFVAVGEGGAVMRSTDGSTWNQQPTVTSQNLLCVGYGAGWFVAAGDGGTVIRSSDGITWTAETTGTTYYFESARYHSDRFYIAGEQATIMTSPYGSGWTALTTGSTANLRDTAYSGSEIVAVGGGGTVLRSPCGGGSLAVTSVTPNQGPTAGGTNVTIAGTGFASGATVTFGGNAATGVNVASATSITCTTPAHGAGIVNVTVTNPSGGGSATLNNGFTYTDVSSITVTAVNPNQGPTGGGTNVTITGSGFQTGAQASFGGAAATGVIVASTTSITCASPAHAAGAVNVTVTNPGGASATLNNGFTYGGGGTVAVTACTPNSGPESGGTAVTITGTGFQSPADVNFGGTPASSVNVVSTTSITCTTPAHDAGAVGVEVVVHGVGAAILPGGFTYGGGPPPPVITSVQHLGNPFRLRVLGSNFHPGCILRINGNPAPATSFKNNGKLVAKGGAALKAMVPAGVLVQITVLNTDDGGVSAPFPFSR